MLSDIELKRFVTEEIYPYWYLLKPMLAKLKDEEKAKEASQLPGATNEKQAAAERIGINRQQHRGQQ